MQPCISVAGFNAARQCFGLMTGHAWQCIVVSSLFHNDSCLKLFATNRAKVTLHVLTSSLSVLRVSRINSWITVCHGTNPARKNGVCPAHGHTVRGSINSANGEEFQWVKFEWLHCYRVKWVHNLPGDRTSHSTQYGLSGWIALSVHRRRGTADGICSRCDATERGDR